MMSSEHKLNSDTDTKYCTYTEYDEGENIDGLPATGENSEGTERNVWNALYEVQDPEMPISVVDLGLIYDVEIDNGRAAIDMTFTYTGCPARDMLQEKIREAAATAEGINDVDLRLVWSPEWSVEMVTEQGKDDLREFGLSI